MMINIIFNTWNSYHRQNVAIDSYRYLRQMYPNNIKLWNIQFKDEEQDFIDFYQDIPKIFCLSNSKEVVMRATKKLPFMNEIFQAGLTLDGNGFIWINSDCVLTKVLIDRILNTDPQNVVCSRIEIEPIDSFQKIIEQRVKPIRWEIAGVDGIYFNKNWAIENQKYFSSLYLGGKFLFDCHWGGACKIFGDNQPIENGYPVSIFHQFHGNSAVTDECPERDWNLKIAKSDPMNILCINTWVLNLTQNLMRRKPYGSFLEPVENERVIEKVLFDCMNIHRNLT